VTDPANESEVADPSASSEPEKRTAEAENSTAELEATIIDLEDQLRRALADLDNVRKRTAREGERTRADERTRVAASFLPIVDHLELALAHAAGDARAVIEGVEAVRDQAVETLNRLGFTRHDDVGERFDPARHEAVARAVSDEVPPGTVVDVVRPGYGDGDRQLRPAAVVVSAREE
jgi:molecular chaperone GrpE